MKKRTKILLLAAAIVLLCIAAALNYKLDNLGARSEIVNKINAFGYELDYADLYITGDTPSASIRTLMTDVPLEDAVEASRQCGFDGDVDRVGEVVVLLASISETEVITVFTVNGQIELCFIQILNSYEVKPLCRG
ncbi:MAG: hypothetical protein AAGU74_08710 [Bacillota bacterium]